MKLFFIFLLLGLCLAKAASILAPLVPSENYTHTLIVNEDNPKEFQLFWKHLDNDEIQFEAHVNTTGWFGIGLSPNGGMGGSDIVIGWVKDNKANLVDCFAKEKLAPVVDKQQDYVLLSGAEIGGYTIMKYKRKYATCDSNDIEIKKKVQSLIFAWNNQDPSIGNTNWLYHGPINRYSQAVLLFNFKDDTINHPNNNLPNDTFTFDIRVNNVKVPKQDTYYYCELVELPKFDKPVHMIQYEVLFQKDTKKHYHHLVVNECDDGYVPDNPFAGECGRVTIPSHITRNCFSKLFIAWGMGGQANYSFPKQAGYRMDPVTKPRYLYVELHYDNPQLKENMSDSSSGFRMYFTNQLRQHDIGLFVLGADGSPLSLQIPPKSNHFEFTSICYPECTQKFIPESGIWAFSAFLHQHYAGRSIRTTLVRNDTAISHIFDNPVYNFDYQFIIDIEPVLLQKGDVFITKCTLETSDRENFTYEGADAHDEMCFSYIYYYPRIPSFSYCFSYTSAETTQKFYDSLAAESLIPSIKINQTIFLNEKYEEEIGRFFNTKVNKTSKLTKRFEDFYSSNYTKGAFCGYANDFLDFEKAHYEPKKNAIIETEVCNYSNRISIKFVDLSLILIISIILCSYVTV